MAAGPRLVALFDALDGAEPPCAEDPEAWTSGEAEHVAAAVEGCSRCPATAACDAYAQSLRPSVGTWAGQQWTANVGQPGHVTRQSNRRTA